MATAATAGAGVLLRRAGRRQLLSGISSVAPSPPSSSSSSSSPSTCWFSSRRQLRIPPLSSPPQATGRWPRGEEERPHGFARPTTTSATTSAATRRVRCLSSKASSAGGGGDGDGSGGRSGGEDGGLAAETVSTIALGSKLSFKTIVDGSPMAPEDFEGKAVLVVNTASLCGLTPQLKELELVHKRFQEQGLVVLGVPSNDFGAQEPWEEDKIREFYAKDFGVTFPLTSKTVVVGPEAHPLYSAVIAEFGQDVGPQWNFHKLLVGADGALAGVFGSNLSPLEPDVTEAIEDALPTKSEPAS